MALWETKQAHRKEIQKEVTTHKALEKYLVKYCVCLVCFCNLPYLSAYLVVDSVVRWTWGSVSLQFLLPSYDLLCVQSGRMFFIQKVDEKNNSQKKKTNSKKDMYVP